LETDIFIQGTQISYFKRIWLVEMLEILIQSSWRQRHIIFQSFGD